MSHQLCPVINTAAIISDYLRPDIAAPHHADDWNYPSDPEFVDVSDADIPVIPAPTSKPRRQKRRAQPQSASQGSIPSSSPRVFRKNRLAMGPSVSAALSKPPASPRTPKRIRPKKRAPTVTSDEESFVNSASPVVMQTSSSDADVDIYYPPRINLRPRALTVDIAPEPPSPTHDTTVMDPLDTALEETIDNTVASTLLQSPSQQADSLQAILTDHAYTTEDTTWVSELATRRQVARDWLRDNPSEPLPWHLSTVLAQDVFDEDTRHRIRQFDITSGKPKTLTDLYPSTSDDDQAARRPDDSSV